MPREKELTKEHDFQQYSYCLELGGEPLIYEDTNQVKVNRFTYSVNRTMELEMKEQRTLQKH